jgi:subtilisin family serine protease
VRIRRAWGLLVVAGLLTLITGPAQAAAPNDPGYAKQWGMTLIGAPTAWDWGTGKGVTIAIVDTGIDLTHEDLQSQLAGPGKNFVTTGAPAQDDNGHGTHVAGIAAAASNNGKGVVGVAPDAKVLPVKVLDSNGSAVASTAVEDGINYAAAQGAKVINLSLGDAGQNVTGASFADACEAAWNNYRAVCVVAAGNGYVGGSGIPSSDHILVVSATQKDDTASVYSSGVGTAMWGIAAPGGAGNAVSFGDNPNDIFSTYWQQGTPNVYAYDAGTSMAAPHVSGALAVMLSLGLPPQDAVQRLLASAKKLDGDPNHTQFGAGRLDLANAVKDLPKPGSGGGSPSTTVAAPGTTVPPAPGTTPPPTKSGSTPRPSTAIGTVPRSAGGSSGGGGAIGSPSPVTSIPDGVAVGPTKDIANHASHQWLWIGGAVVLIAAVGGAIVASRLS